MACVELCYCMQVWSHEWEHVLYITIEVLSSLKSFSFQPSSTTSHEAHTVAPVMLFYRGIQLQLLHNTDELVTQLKSDKAISTCEISLLSLFAKCSTSYLPLPEVVG